VRRFAILGVLAIVAVFASAAPASASGPAAPGKSIVQVNCGSAGTFWVSVPKSNKNNAVGQIVGAKGHGIPVSITFTVTDDRTSTDLFTSTTRVGGGHAHPNQHTISCTFVPFPAAPASQFFNGSPPPGVAPTDMISALGAIKIILKR
jgi:hypothetical protein